MRFSVIFISALTALQAFGQAVDTGIVVNIDVGYNTAYRDGSWVPVDVLIENEQRDFNGWAEVRVYDMANVMQSPAYRVAADCPQNSTKRFRLYAWIDNAQRVEAVLYENERLAVDVPAYVEPQPIDEDDFLAVILDEDPLNYQFLYEPLRQFEGTRRLSRDDLNSATLSLLPDRLAAYEALDFVIIGDVDLSRMPLAQRALLLEYVELGGTLVVFTGVHAQRVRDSWLAPHLGVGVGAVTTQAESLYRAAVYGETPPFAPDESRICTWAKLVESDPAVETFGEYATLAARRDLGSGRIFTFAIDAASHALQGDRRYGALWHTILASIDRDDRTLDTETMGVTFVNNLPQVSGVTIRPVSDVLIYLGLYIGVGIVLNWVFWSRVGRREYAWLTLLLVSFSFTAYAVISGTSGIEGRQSRHQFTLLHAGKQSTLAWQYAMTGILSARVTEVDEPLEDESVLVREAGVPTSAGRWGIPHSALQQPFKFVEAPEPAVQDLRIGANEVRGFSTTQYRRLEGPIEGVVDDVDGMVTARVENRTGLPFDSAMLYLHGKFYPLERAGGNDTFTIAEERMDYDERMGVFSDASYGGYWPSGFYSSDWESLLSYLTLSPLIDPVTSAPDPYLGPYFIGTVNSKPVSEMEAGTGYSATVLVAELAYSSERSERYPLPQRFGDYSRYSFPRPGMYEGWQATLASRPLDLYLRVPDPLRERSNSYIEVELSVADATNVDIVLTDGNGSQLARAPQAGAPEAGTKHYRIHDWSSLVEAVSGDVRLRVDYATPGATTAVNVYVNAAIVVEPAQSAEKEWPGWR